VVLIDTVIFGGGSEVMDADGNILRERHGSEPVNPYLFLCDRITFFVGFHRDSSLRGYGALAIGFC
jgi:hypothetical protein